MRSRSVVGRIWWCGVAVALLGGVLSLVGVSSVSATGWQTQGNDVRVLSQWPKHQSGWAISAEATQGNGVRVLSQWWVEYSNYRLECSGTQPDSDELRCEAEADRVLVVRVQAKNPGRNSSADECGEAGSRNDGHYLQPVSLSVLEQQVTVPSSRACVTEGHVWVGESRVDLSPIRANSEGDSGNNYQDFGSTTFDLRLSTDVSTSVQFTNGVALWDKPVGSRVGEVCFSTTGGWAHIRFVRGFFRSLGIAETGFEEWCVKNPNPSGWAIFSLLSDVSEWAKVAQDRAANQADLEQLVPHDWPLIPAGVGSGEKFRLLFITSTGRDGTSSNIADYNAFVQNAASGGHVAIRDHASKYRAVASTSSIDARENVRAWSSFDVAAPTYWLNGSRISPDYSATSSGLWGLRWGNSGLADRRDEQGQVHSYSYPAGALKPVWTGTRSGSGVRSFGNGTLGGLRPTVGSHGANAFHTASRPSASVFPLYGMSPVYVVQAADTTNNEDTTSSEDTSSSEYSVPASLIADVQGYAAETSNGVAHVDRWKRVLVAFGEAVPGFVGVPMTAAEATQHAQTFWSVRWDPVAAALTALEAAQVAQAQSQQQSPSTVQQQQTQQQQTQSYVVPASLVADVQGYAAETSNGVAHVNRWKRVLVAFGEAVPGFSGTAMSAAEATQHAQAFWSVRWDPVVAALTALEAQPAPETSGDETSDTSENNPPPADPPSVDPVPVDPPVVDPVVSVTAGADITEGSDAVFTLTASPAPTAPLDVTVEVTASGDYGATAGTRTVTVPPTGTATLTVATTDDGTDEADGSVTATITNGTGYDPDTSAATATVNVTDNDDPPPPPPPPTSLSAFSVTDGTHTEGSGNYYFFFVSLDKPVNKPTRVSYTVEATGNGPGHATAGDDFVATSRTIFFRPGLTRNVGLVIVKDDNLKEPNETLQIVLSNPQGASINGGTATITIQDND